LGAHHKLRLFNHPSINVYRIYKKWISYWFIFIL
jgi:hypothetical protein